jgi:hypothetical protein
MELTFIQLAPFVKRRRRFGLTDEDLQSLEQQFRRNPLAGAVMQ